MRDITGCVAMISGANRGIGEAIAAALHADGWALSLGARSLASLEASVASYRTDDHGPAITLHRHDATDPEAAARWTAETVAAHGRIDCLVNNAGVAHTGGIFDTPEAALDEMWEVNAKGPLRMIRATLDHLRRSGEGRIVNVISMSGKRVRGTFAPGYAMTKHAATAMHHAVRHATFGDGIRCTAVCPGFVQTDMTADSGVDPSLMIQPEDLAAAVATILRLPNTASVAELLVTIEPETIA